MEFISDKLIYTNIQYKITKQPLLYTYTYAYIHTYIHTYVHTYIHQEYIYQGWSCCILSRQSQHSSHVTALVGLAFATE